MSRVPVITIDGPGASGKTVVGIGLAGKLGYQFVDTGSMYRAVTWEALQKEISLDGNKALSQLASSTSLEFSAGNGSPRLLANGKDISDEIHSPAVDRAVSKVSMIPGVREALVRLQRTLAQRHPVVMAGRDIGTVVLPNAGLKIFLIAPVEQRARRRHAELKSNGTPIQYTDVLADLRDRDWLDSAREISPLTPASDARTIDTSGLSPEDVVEEIWQHTEKR